VPYAYTVSHSKLATYIYTYTHTYTVLTAISQFTLASIKAWLLQRCAPLHSTLQHPETTACSEQCSTDHSPGAKVISHQSTTMPAALAAGSTSNYVQVGRTDVEGPDHINTSVHQAMWQRADSTLDHDHSIVRIVRQYSIC